MAMNNAVRRAWPSETLSDGGSAAHQIEERDYLDVEERLRKMELACEQKDDAAARHLLNAALRICRACQQSRHEAEWHGRACAEVLEREQALRVELRTILKLIGHPAASDKPTVLAVGTPQTDVPSRVVTVADHLRRRTGGADTHPFESRRPWNLENGAVSADAAPRLVVCCLGPFQVYLNDKVVNGWRNRKSKSVFKYLVTRRDRSAAKEVLMDLFWPEASPEQARNSLNVAIYHIRHSLSVPSSFSHVLFQDNCYRLNPELEVWVDSEAFSRHVGLARALEQRDELESTIREYRSAEALYAGAFLEEDRYDEWMAPMRQALEDGYLTVLDRLSQHYFEQQEYDRCVTVCHKMLAVDPCHEQAHRQVMRCYGRRDEANLALRQYQCCVRALDQELGALPSVPTTDLMDRIRSRAGL